MDGGSRRRECADGWSYTKTYAGLALNIVDGWKMT